MVPRAVPLESIQLVELIIEELLYNDRVVPDPLTELHQVISRCPLHCCWGGPIDLLGGRHVCN